MDVRPASGDDWNAIRRIATNSFEASYSLSPLDIQNILDDEFGESALVERIGNSRDIVLVAGEDLDTNGTISGFIEYQTDTNPMIRWLHVDPDARGAGVATSLVETVQRKADGQLHARVLETAVEGNEFLHRFGLVPEGDEEILYGGEAYHASILSKAGTEEDTNEPAVDVPARVTVDGSELRIVRNEVPGRDAPFFPLRSGEERIGYFCSSCGSTNIAGGSLERLECENCGNRHRADQWDDAYL